MPDNQFQNTSLNWMPDGKGSMMPVPDLLTQEEVIRYTRLDQTKTRFPENTLGRYRKNGLRAVQFGKQVLYPRKELEKFIEKLMISNPR